ncbi:MAG: hypothetical protein IFJ96_04395 [Acidobacteria bacterium]|nr:hypothetical protein [Candidatus Sulfomarinibacter sp. MAG AM2]
MGLATDPAPGEVTGKFRQGSHVKLFLPNLPYLAISHAINASLVRPANNDDGWQYDLAVDHRSDGDRIWEFRLRQGVRFQDGTPFDADSVILNMAYFKKQPDGSQRHRTLHLIDEQLRVPRDPAGGRSRPASAPIPRSR